MLDAADKDILEVLGEEHGGRAAGPELLRELMLDVLGRYATRRHRRVAAPRPVETGR